MRVHARLTLLLLFLCSAPSPLEAQKLYSYETEYLRLIYYNEAHAYIVPHLARSFENSLEFHRRLFNYTPSEKIVILLHDFGDFGHGGTSTVPWNFMSIGIEPFDYVYETQPANERMNWLMHHELVHVVATDKGAGPDLAARKFFGGKVAPTTDNPISMAYSFMTSPRWYSPRWYHEGIAVFLETWMAGGLGRVLGGYDEMVFRTMVNENRYFYDIVGLESEGTTIDFQVGQNSYLYGTRFVTYLALQHGPEKLIQWFNRTEDSRAYFSKQFKQVYGQRLEDAWEGWIEWERHWQEKNLARIREFPVTQYRRILPDREVGSVSRSFFDEKSGVLYAAINYPGSGAHLAAIDVQTGEVRRIKDVSVPALYYVTSVAHDPDGRRLFYTTDNTRGWRDLREVDLVSGKARVLLKDCRTGDLVFNRNDGSIWGIQHNNGFSSLVRIPKPYEGWNTLLTLPYGKDIFDIDLSPDGRYLSASLIEVDGRQRLVRLEVERLLQGDSTYDVLHEFESNSPANFVFSPDGRYLWGTSYYTGVSNVFRYSFETGQMEAITNAETGFFRPQQISETELLAYVYTGDGFTPVRFPIETREDLNAIDYLGQQIVEKHPVVTTWNAGAPTQVDLDSRKTYEGEYRPIKNVSLGSAYPVVEAYRDSTALGYRFNLSDSIGFQSLDVTATVSVDDVPADERFHINAVYQTYPWKFRVAYNASNFYDLFGPTKRSRKGFAGEARYEGFLWEDGPARLDYSAGAGYYFGLDELPDFQGIGVSFDRLLTTYAGLNFKNVRRTIGAVEEEKGLSWDAYYGGNLANKEFFPRVYGGVNYGFLLPLDHSSLWLRGSAGRSWGDRDNSFSNFYFGGFGNNWVDRYEVRRYREYDSFPGLEINEIGGRSFGKLLAEWTLPPIRFKRVGFPVFYANWAQVAFFGSGLVLDLEDEEFRHKYANAGVQLDLKLVMFSTLDSTLSFGFARAFPEAGSASNEFMVSLKLLR